MLAKVEMIIFAPMRKKETGMLDMEAFKVFLKKKDLKATPQRLAVHEAMLSLVHASADMVSSEIQENKGVKVTVASVYNILSQMASAGVYRRRLNEGGKMFFDVNPVNHFHLYDVTDGVYRDIMDEELSVAIQKWLSHKRFKGYKVTGYDLQILCRPSRKRRSTL